MVVVAVFAVVLAVAAGAIATRAKAGPATTKQEVVITVSHGSSPEPFVLTSHSPGLRRVRGTATFCCWTVGTVVRDGQKLDKADPEMTLTGKRGTIVTRNRIVWMTVPGGAIYTGTWKVIRATGAYAGLTGSGLAAGAQLPSGDVNARFTGFVNPK